MYGKGGGFSSLKGIFKSGLGGLADQRFRRMQEVTRKTVRATMRGFLTHRDIIGVFHGLNEESFRRRN
jgi:hypothetical protein